MGNFKFNSTQMIEFANKKRQMCKEKGWDWSAYYNGFLDGFATHFIESEREEKKLEITGSCDIPVVSTQAFKCQCPHPTPNCYSGACSNCGMPIPNKA